MEQYAPVDEVTKLIRYAGLISRPAWRPGLMSVSIGLKIELLQDESFERVSKVLRRVARRMNVTPAPDRPLHGSARTTREQRREIKQSQLSLRDLADEFNIDPKTARKWKRSESVEDKTMGPKKGTFRALSEQEQSQIRQFFIGRQISLRAALKELKKEIPHLTPSTLNRFRATLPQSQGVKSHCHSAEDVLKEIIKIGAGRDSDVLIERISRG